MFKSGVARPIAEWLLLSALSAALSAGMLATHVPAAFLLGPMIAAIALAVSGAQAKLSRGFSLGAQTILGCLIAAAINPTLLHVAASHWALLVGFSLATMLLTAVLGWSIAKGGWLPGTTAIWGLSPGAASAMVLLADDYGADKRMVAMMQYSRIVLVALAAILVAGVIGHQDGKAPAASLGGVPTQWLAWPPPFVFAQTVALAVSGGIAARLLGKSSLALFVPAFGGAALQGAGIISIAVPPLLSTLAFGVIGWYVGLSFTRPVLIHSLRLLPRMLVAIVAMIAMCGGLSLLLAWLLPGTDPLTAYLAMSPGGIDTAVIIASGADVYLPLILAAQFIRLLFVIAGAPALAKLVARRHLQG